MLHIDLTLEERDLLEQMLDAGLTDLRGEISATHRYEYKEDLKQREVLLRKIIAAVHEARSWSRNWQFPRCAARTPRLIPYPVVGVRAAGEFALRSFTPTDVSLEMAGVEGVCCATFHVPHLLRYAVMGRAHNSCYTFIQEKPGFSILEGMNGWHAETRFLSLSQRGPYVRTARRYRSLWLFRQIHHHATA
jgi:hypothetical protein